MLIDIHTHLGEFSESLELEETFARTGEVPSPVVDAYLKAIDGCDRAVLLALDGRVTGYFTSNATVAWMVKRHPKLLVGFASVNPLDPNAPDTLERAVVDSGLRGVKLGPMYQLYRPDDEAVFPIYERAVRLGVPTLTHQGTSFLGRTADLGESNPVRLDRVARTFPDLRIVIAHLGYPWGGEVVALLRKHPHVYADCSALTGRPWFLFNTLLNAHEYGALDKVLLGSDYPGITSRQARDAVLALAHLTDGTNLPRIPIDRLQALVESDSLSILGISA
jgi:predicted TIM-barrel fold metal-dependent hydrolase